MARFRLHLTTGAETSIDFQAPYLDADATQEDVEDAFWKLGPDTPTLCHQCAGGGHFGQNLSVSNEWEVVEITALGDDE